MIGCNIYLISLNVINTHSETLEATKYILLNYIFVAFFTPLMVNHCVGMLFHSLNYKKNTEEHFGLSMFKRHSNYSALINS